VVGRFGDDAEGCLALLFNEDFVRSRGPRYVGGSIEVAQWLFQVNEGPVSVQGVKTVVGMVPDWHR
jgi:hypothetical protein